MLSGHSISNISKESFVQHQIVRTCLTFHCKGYPISNSFYFYQQYNQYYKDILLKRFQENDYTRWMQMLDVTCITNFHSSLTLQVWKLIDKKKCTMIHLFYSHHIQQQEGRLHKVFCHTFELEFAFLINEVKKNFGSILRRGATQTWQKYWRCNW